MFGSYQQGLKVVRGAVMNRRYDYTLADGKSFLLMVLSGRRMVQDYFVRREQGKDCGAWQACIPFCSLISPRMSTSMIESNKNSVTSNRVFAKSQLLSNHYCSFWTNSSDWHPKLSAEHRGR